MQLNKNHARKICPSIEYVGLHSAKSIKLGNKNVIALLCATPRTLGYLLIHAPRILGFRILGLRILNPRTEDP